MTISLLAFCDAWLLVPFVFYTVTLILFAIAAIGIATTDEEDTGLGFWATVSSLAIVAVACVHFGVTLHGIKEHLGLDLVALVGYLVVGVVWSFAKWYFHLSNVIELFQSLKADYISRKGITAEQLLTPVDTTSLLGEPVKADYRNNDAGYRRAHAEWAETRKIAEFFELVNRHMRVYKSASIQELCADPTKIIQHIKPEASKHKAAITEWIAFWPVSLVWTVINDPIRKIVNYIFSHIKGTFQRMADAMFADIQ